MNRIGNPILSKNYVICFLSEIQYIFFVGIGFTFSLHILFLFENGKRIAAALKWHLHSQKEYPF